jgi:hypothetical protein
MAFIECSSLLQQLGDERRPSGLMAGADAGTGVAVEILVKGNQPGPERIPLEALDVAEHRTAALPVLEEDAAEPS